LRIGGNSHPNPGTGTVSTEQKQNEKERKRLDRMSFPSQVDINREIPDYILSGSGLKDINTIISRCVIKVLR